MPLKLFKTFKALHYIHIQIIESADCIQTKQVANRVYSKNK